MKRIVLLFVIVFTTMMASACGNSTPVVTQAPQVQPVVTEAPTQPAATDTPAASASATVVTITLADNTIESSLTEFKTGVPYTFVITNTGTHPHNFNISTPVSIAGSLDKAQSTALLSVERNQLSPGANVSVDYTFPDSAAEAQLEFSCLIQRHYQDGMYLTITVTK